MVKIGTHNGTFHCDEVLACFLLKQLPEYKAAEIVRSRDQKILDTCDIVVDVGGVFDHKLKRYDHHQRTFNETFKSLVPEKPWDIKLSSAGLVYVYYGKQILSELCKQWNTDVSIETLYDKMYDSFVLEIDAIDNGVSVCSGEPKYSIRSGLSNRVGHINPWWNAKDSDETTAFYKAMNLIEIEFVDRLNFYVNCWWPARKFVSEAVDNRFQVHPSGKILKLSVAGCPWKMHLFDIEKEMFGNPVIQNGDNNNQTKYELLYVLYSDGVNWRVQCVSVDENQGFVNRLGLNSEWRGLREEELNKVSGINDCIFVHNSGFIGGNKTYEGALQMAVKTMENAGYLN